MVPEEGGILRPLTLCLCKGRSVKHAPCCGSLVLICAVMSCYVLKTTFGRGNQRLAGGRTEIWQEYRWKLEKKKIGGNLWE